MYELHIAHAHTCAHACGFFCVCFFFFPLGADAEGRETTGGRVKLESESLAGRLKGGGGEDREKWGRGRKTGRGLALTTQTSSREWELLYNGQVARLHNLHTPAGKKKERKNLQQQQQLGTT